MELIDQAARMGIGFVAFEGGEPLLRDDIGILLAHAKRRSMITTLITNGYLFEKRMDDVLDGLDVLAVSLDGPERVHDRMRGVDGIFKRAVACRELARGKKFFFNSVLNETNFNHVEDIVRIADEQRTMVSFCPAFNYSGARALGGEESRFLEAVRKLSALKKMGMPVMNSYAFLEHILKGRKARCVYPKLFMNTNPEGRIVFPCPAWEGGYHPCEKVTEGKMIAVWDSPRHKMIRMGGMRCRACDGCRFIDSTEASLIMRGDLGLLVEYMRIWQRIGT
jgi:MoaA/NifB/PqqE/SkfB family radical SAM enzyme